MGSIFSYCKLTFLGLILEELTYKELIFKELNLKRLNFKELTLKGVNPVGANFRRVDFQEADLYGANLDGANLGGVDLTRTLGLTVNQLSKVRTLSYAKLDEELEILLREKYPALFKEPEFQISEDLE